MKKQLTFGVDFDGTIVSKAFPNIGEINEEVVKFMDAAIKQGHLVIVWTARSINYEQDAIDFLNKNNVPYSYVNENPEDEYAKKGIQGRKIFCDYYLDDRAVNVKDLKSVLYPIVGLNVTAKLKNRVVLHEANDEDEIIFSGEVEIIRELPHLSEAGTKLYIIFDPKINDSTVVHGGILEF